MGPRSKLMHTAAQASPFLSPYTWFQPAFPLGTLYDIAHRGEDTLRSMDQGQLDEAKALAPFNNRVLYRELICKWDAYATPTQMAAQFDALTGYDTWAIEVVANGVLNDPDRYEAIFTRLCQFNPNKYLQLGTYLCEHQRPEAAARAFQKGVDLAPDRVWMSNTVGWLVNYYYDHDRKAEAFAVAEMAAEVYSSRGLETMALLCERADRVPDAETYFRKLAERYERWEELLVFYNRHRSEPKYALAAARLTDKVFPDGREEMDIARLSGVPTSGVILTSNSKTTAVLGLVAGDVIVAVNGVRIQNKSQYFYQMDTAASEKVDLIVFSRRRYRTIAATLPDHRLGATIAIFQPPAAR
jgi:tetratricopeptide (TPR) repeat protein